MCGATLVVSLACSAGDGEGGADGKGGQTSADPSEASGPDPAAPSDDPVGDGPGATDGDGTSSFEDYAPTCEEQQCTGDEVCKATQSGSECFVPCPGQPCPPVDGLVPYCDRQGGVSCFEG